MNDDLVKLLRKLGDGDLVWTMHSTAADRIEELEAKLAKIESLMVHLVKFAEQSKAKAGSGNSKRREHYRMHTLSEALGQIRKVMKGQDDE